jgi:capsular exopolysaccharide synthesis family protein
VGFTSIPDVLLIRVSSSRPDDAVVLVRTIAEVYRQTVTSQRQAALRQLQQARNRVEETLHQKQQRLAQLENTRLAAAQKECQQAQFNLRVARAEAADQERRRPNAETVTISEQAIHSFLKEDPLIRKRLQEVEEAEEQIKKCIRVSALKERDPDLPELYQQRDAARKRLEERRKVVRPLAVQNERSRVLAEYQTQLAHRRERVAFYEGLVQSLEEEVQRLGGAAAEEEMKTLQEQVTAAGESLRRLAADHQRLENTPAPAELAQTGEMVAVQRLNAKGRLQPAGLGGAGCCALLMLAVSWRELRLRRIISGSDIATGLALPVLGNIPAQRIRDRLTTEQLEGGGHLGEAVDSLRTILLHENVVGPRILLITSAVSGEGKTSLAALLAASLARAWRKTLLVDADLRKPQAHQLFQTELEPGLSELLRGEAEAAEVIQQTELGRLWMIPAGQWDSHAIQALAQEGIGQVFDPLKEQFDFIVMDAGPVLPVADALLLSKHVDTLLLAVRSGFSRLPVVQAAQQRLLALEAPLRGAVLIGPDTDLQCKAFRFARRVG